MGTPRSSSMYASPAAVPRGRVRLHDAERAAVGRHRARAEIGMRVEDRDAHRRVGGLNHADQPSRRNHGTVPLDPRRASRRERQRGDDVFARPGPVQRLGRNETPFEPRAEPDDLPKLVVLRPGAPAPSRRAARPSRGDASRSLETHALRQRSAPACSPTSGATIVRRSAPAIGSRRLAGSTIAMSDKTTQPTNRPASIRLPRRAAVATDLPQVLRTDQYFSSSSRMRPVPRTTHVSGSSST